MHRIRIAWTIIELREVLYSYGKDVIGLLFESSETWTSQQGGAQPGSQ